MTQVQSLPVLVAYEVNGDVICLSCLNTRTAGDPRYTRGIDLVPLFRAEIKTTDRCIICNKWINEEVRDD